MNKEKFKNLDLTLYSKTLSNGLKVFIVPKTNVNNVYVTFSTNYGSIHDEFIPLNESEYYKVPMGVAHFLEHKVFEQKDGIDPFTFYTEHGADANANTSNFKTTYLFSGPKFVNENINYLLDFVQDPYFTDENVLKEKGIIEQEIKMYDDIPFWKLYDCTLFNAFVKHPIKYPVAGTKDTIYNITKEDLYKCYNTFYHPSNMFVTVTGNVNPDLIIKVIEDNQNKKKFLAAEPIVLQKYDEPDDVAKRKEIIHMDVEIPKVAVAYKINIGNYDINTLEKYLNIIFNVKLGSASILAEKLKKKNYITEDIDFEVIPAGNHLLYLISFETKYPERVIKLIDKELANLDIDESELNRKKKVLKSSCTFKSDNIYSINSKINNNIITYGYVIMDDYGVIEELNIETLREIISSISLSNKTITVLTK